MTQSQLSAEVMADKSGVPRRLNALQRIIDRTELEKIVTQNKPNNYPHIKKYAQLLIDLGIQGDYKIDFKYTTDDKKYTLSSLNNSYSTAPTMHTCAAANLEIKITRPNSKDYFEKTDITCPNSITTALGSRHTFLKFSLDWQGLYRRLGLPTTNLYDDSGYTPLLRAVLNGDDATVYKLLNAGANPNLRKITKNSRHRNYLHESPLEVAVKSGNVEIVSALLKAGADPNSGGVFDATPLYKAVESGNAEIVKLLLKSGANPNEGGVEIDDESRAGAKKNYIQSGKTRRTPLQLALDRSNDKKDLNIVLSLLSAGADVDLVPENSSTTPSIIFAVTEFPTSILIAMLKAGANPNVRDRYDNTALHTSTRPIITKALLEAGADLNALNNRGETPLHAIVKNSNTHSDVITLLIEAGANVNSRNIHTGKTPLHDAVKTSKGDIWIISTIIEAGADVNAQSNTGATPLHIAAGLNLKNQEYRIRVAATLIESGANVNAQRKDGATPLNIALGNRKGKIIASLLKRHGGLKLPDSRLKAKEHGLPKILIKSPTQAQKEAAKQFGCHYLKTGAPVSSSNIPTSLRDKKGDFDNIVYWWKLISCF